MKRLHIHISVPELESAILFYTQMFGTAPTKLKPDYAKWQLDDPRVNFAVSTRSSRIGLDHLGIQVDDEEELKQLNNRLMDHGIDTGTLDSTTCCYAESVKSWSFDPAGIPWESFITMNDAEVYGKDDPLVSHTKGACCPGQSPSKDSLSRCC
jgi:uncharacterized glyoxalase superfamily protein PhnB